MKFVPFRDGLEGALLDCSVLDFVIILRHFICVLYMIVAQFLLCHNLILAKDFALK